MSSFEFNLIRANQVRYSCNCCCCHCICSSSFFLVSSGWFLFFHLVWLLLLVQWELCNYSFDCKVEQKEKKKVVLIGRQSVSSIFSLTFVDDDDDERNFAKQTNKLQVVAITSASVLRGKKMDQFEMSFFPSWWKRESSRRKQKGSTASSVEAKLT